MQRAPASGGSGRHVFTNIPTVASSSAATAAAASLTAAPTVEPPNSRARSASRAAPGSGSVAACDATEARAQDSLVGSCASSAARSQSVSAAQRTQLSSSDQRRAAPDRSSSATGKSRGRVAEAPSDRVARVLRKRQELVAGIRQRVQQSNAGVDAAIAALTPLDQLLPSPPDVLLHQMALQWMAPVATDSSEPRGATLHLHLRESFSKGTELQLLCAMADLPVLPSTTNNSYRMGRYLFAAVRLYAEQNEQIFRDGPPSCVGWEGDDNVPTLTTSTRQAIARAAADAVREIDDGRPVEGYVGIASGHVGMATSHVGMATDRVGTTTDHIGLAQEAKNRTLVAEQDPPHPPPYDALDADILAAAAPPIGSLPLTLPGAAEGHSSPLPPSDQESSAPQSQQSICIPATPSSLDESAACPTQVPQELVGAVAGAAAARQTESNASDLSQLPHSAAASLAPPDGAADATDSASPAVTRLGASAPCDGSDAHREFHPDSAVSVAQLLPQVNGWLRPAIEAAAGSRKRPLKTTAVKRRLIAAACMALEMHDLTTAELRDTKLQFSMEALIAPDSSHHIPLGHGLFCPRLYDIIASYGWPRPTQNADVEDIDLAARALLRAIHAADAIQRGQILDGLRTLCALPRQRYVAHAGIEHYTVREQDRLVLRLPLSSNAFDVLDAPDATEAENGAEQPLAPVEISMAQDTTDGAGEARRSSRRSVPTLAVVESQAAEILARELRDTAAAPPVSIPHPSPPDPSEHARCATVQPASAGPTGSDTSDSDPSAGEDGMLRPSRSRRQKKNEKKKAAKAQAVTPATASVAASPMAPPVAAAVPIRPPLPDKNSASRTAAFAAAAALPLQSVHMKQVSGDGHCFWSCVEAALGETRLQLKERIRATIAGIDDATVLTKLGLWDAGLSKSSSAEEVLAAKRAYFRSPAFVQLVDGGTAEMLLLCHAFAGSITFLSVSSSSIGAAPVLYKSPFHEITADTRQVTLHHCSFIGSGDTANHWDLFEYRLTGSARDAVRLPYWPHSQQETPVQYDKRLRMLQREADDDTQRKMTKHRKQAQEAETALERLLQREEWSPIYAGGKPRILSPPRRVEGRKPPRPADALQPRLSFRAKGVATGVTPSSAMVTRPHCVRALDMSPAGRLSGWRHRKVGVLQQLTPISRPIFLGVVTSILERYREFSLAKEYQQCQEVVHLLMDYPADALRAGGTAAQRQAWMQEASTAVEEQLHSLGAATAPAAVLTTAPPADTTSEIHDSPTSPVAPAIEQPPTQPLSQESIGHAVPSDVAATAPVARASAQEDEDPRAAALTAAVRRAKTILNQGGPHALQRAAKALRAGKLARCDRHTFRVLDALHPRGASLSPLPHNRAPEVGSLEKVMDRIIKRIDNGSSPGVSGWNGSHLTAIWASDSKAAKDGLHLLLRDICNGIFSGECRKRLLACRLVPLEKKDRGVRPIAIAEVFTKAAAHCAVALVEESVPSLFPSIQYGVKRIGGSETAAHLIRNLLRDHGDQHRSSTCAIILDFANAFNSISRAKVWQTLLHHDCLGSMLKAFYAQYAEPTELLVYDRNRLVHKVLSTEGVRQGDPFAALAFALTVQSLYEAALKQARAGLADGVSIQDDFTIVGSMEEALKVYDYVKQHAQSDFGLELRVDKCEVYLPAESRAAATAEQLQSMLQSCAERNLQVSSRTESLGVMHGSIADVSDFCHEAVDSADFFFEALEHPDMPVQHASLLLRCCQLPRLGYLARTAHPDQLAAAAQRFDQRAVRCWQTIHRMTDADLAVLAGEDCKDARVAAEQLLRRVSLPVSMGGMGIRPVQRIMHAAYLASSLEALPELLRLRTHLQTVEECAAHVRDSTLFQEIASLLNKLQADGLSLTMLNRRGRRAAERATSVAVSAVAQPAELSSSAQPVPAPPPPPPPPISPVTLPSPVHFPPSVPRTAAVAASILTSSSSDILRKDTDDVWLAASNKAAQGEAAAAQPFVLAYKLQKLITAESEKQLQEKLLLSCHPVQATILRELSHAPQSGAWLLTLPTERAYRLRNDQYLLAVRKRLGMLPDLSLFHDSCLACHGRNLALPEFKLDPSHFEACVRHTGASVTDRHDGVVHALGELARSVGASVRTDQPTLGEAVVAVIDPITGEGIHELQRSNKRGDLLVILGAKRFLIDVTVPRATAPSTMANPAMATAGACTADAEKDKRVKYEALCKHRGLELIPFALESHGGVGPAARAFLNKLASASCDLTAEAFLIDAHIRISVQLQRGNAAVFQRGMQQLRLEQSLMAGGDKAIGGGAPQPASRRRQRRLFNERLAGGAASHQLDVGDAFHSSMRAGGGRAAATRFQDRWVAMESSAA